jgi:hypothetical protein
VKKKRDHLATLIQWAEWGRASALARTLRPDWSAVDTLVNAAGPQLLENAKLLRNLLERTAAQLKLGDPFLCDLGAPRWLQEENSYSDWLAWVLEKLGDARLILGILGVESAEFASVCASEEIYVEREAPVQEGLPGNDGQIDLLISFGEPPRAIVGVEVKTYDQQYWKQEGYTKSLGKLPCDVAPACVLVANDEVSERQLCGFKLRPWKEVSIALRKAIALYAQDCEHLAIVAMMLAFVAAIEQNLLGIDAAAARRAWRGKPTLMPQDLVSYLERAAESP